ncbi:hypothetical protein DFH09DRAFT_230353 [Mycena vulgaris]|nr:hypothetical protein DFH09DRAFT_230353 [Mycena vulgaris]
MAQRRGAKPKDLGPHCLVDEPTGKVCCLLCETVSGGDTHNWMNRASWKKHLESSAHLHSLEHVAQTQQTQAATHQQYNNVYSMSSTSLQAPVLPDNPGPRRPQFRPVLPDEDMNGVSTADFDDLMMQEVDNLRALPELALADNSETLRREIEILNIQSLEDEFEGADDETIPQFVQEIRDNGMLRSLQREV